MPANFFPGVRSGTAAKTEDAAPITESIPVFINWEARSETVEGC